MTTPAGELRVRNLRTLAMLGGLFVLPLAFAFWMYYGTLWRPATLVNHSELISPARPLPDLTLSSGLADQPAPKDALRHKWTLVYIGDGGCDVSCRQMLYVMRQTRLSLNNEMTRIERVFLVTGNCCAQEFLSHEHPGLAVLDASGEAARPLLQVFPAGSRARSLFVVDPLGNLMMSYDARQNPKGLLEDLKKLLTLSHIG
jgi:hypothetical protein